MNWKKIKLTAIIILVPLGYAIMPLVMSDLCIVRFCAFFSCCAFFYILDLMIDIEVKMEFHERLTEHISCSMKRDVMGALKEIEELKVVIEKMKE